MRIKELQWEKESCRPDGKFNRMVAEDSMWDNDSIRIYCRYSISRGPTVETDDVLNVLIQFSAKTVRQKVSTFEEGKKLCEQYREEFWDGLLKTINTEMFKQSNEEDQYNMEQ